MSNDPEIHETKYAQFVVTTAIGEEEIPVYDNSEINRWMDAIIHSLSESMARMREEKIMAELGITPADIRYPDGELNVAKIEAIAKSLPQPVRMETEWTPAERGMVVSRLLDDCRRQGVPISYEEAWKFVDATFPEKGK